VDDVRRFRDRVHRGAPPPGTRLLTAILPDGRTVRLAVAAPLAAASAVRSLADLAEDVAEQRGAATARQGAAIGRLARWVNGDARRLSIAKARRAAVMRRRLVARYRKLDARVTHAVQKHHARVDRQMKVEIESVRRLARRDLWDKIVVASSLPLFAAYGQPGQLFNTANLALTLSLLIWLVGDQIVDAVFGSEEKSAYPLPDTDIWSYLAPVGNVLTGWWLFGDQQNERFITGVTPIALPVKASPVPAMPFSYSTRLDLADRVAPDHREDFETFKGVRVVATIGASRLAQGITGEVQNLRAEVRRGRLHLSFEFTTAAPVLSPPPSLGEIDVAWIVDTQHPTAATP